MRSRVFKRLVILVSVFIVVAVLNLLFFNATPMAKLVLSVVPT